MRTATEVKRQCEGLETMKKWLPEYSIFGDPNWKIIDAQIKILKLQALLSSFPTGDWENNDEENQIFCAVSQADEWLKGNYKEDLFESQP